MIVGGYELHLYCDGAGCNYGDYGRYPSRFEANGELGATCRKQARQCGWKLLPGGYCLCPPCVKRGAKVSND